MEGKFGIHEGGNSFVYSYEIKPFKDHFAMSTILWPDFYRKLLNYTPSSTMPPSHPTPWKMLLLLQVVNRLCQCCNRSESRNTHCQLNLHQWKEWTYPWASLVFSKIVIFPLLRFLLVYDNPFPMKHLALARTYFSYDLCANSFCKTVAY